MKKYSKLIALFLAVALTAVTFTVAVAAMASPDEASPDELAPVISLPEPSISADILDSEQEEELPSDININDEASRPKAEAGIVTDEALRITADAYMFNTERLLLVSVENVTDAAYGIDVTVSYLDGENGVIATETQSFDQLASDYVKNFVFRPEFDFADFRLETAKTEFNGDCWKSKLIVSYATPKFGRGDFHHDYPNGMGEFDFEKGGYVDRYGNVIDHYTAYTTHPTYYVDNQSGIDVVANSVTLVMFDNNGEIYDVLERGGEVYFDKDIDEPNYKSFPTVYSFKAGDAAAEAQMNEITKATGFVACEFILPEDSVYCN